MDIKWQICNDEASIVEFTHRVKGYLVLDTETKGTDPRKADTQLLGISLSGRSLGDFDAVYIPYRAELKELLASRLRDRLLIGHNFTYDKKWIDYTLGINSNWHADTRIMWHLSCPAKPIRGYGLKKAQVEVLGWTESGDKELEENVAAKGGKLKNGDHYMADLAVLAKYAALDAFSTYKLYEALSPFFDTHKYWDFLTEIMCYNQLLAWNTEVGMPIDCNQLEQAIGTLESEIANRNERIREVCEIEIALLEKAWFDIRKARYETERGRTWFESTPTAWRRFNPSSDLHLADLYYKELGFPIIARTDGGKPKVDKAYLRTMDHPVTEHVLAYNKAEKVLGYAKNYLKAAQGGFLHAGYDICGTVSGRLSGFSPNMQQAPFREAEVMGCFKNIPGFIGIHSDLSGIEPCITAHFTDDPTLLKVYRDGLGDIYLDLALDLFSDNAELKSAYNAHKPLQKGIKERFKRERDIAKIIHLAIQYTGTRFTVAKNLTLLGFPTTEEQAQRYVWAYWKRFKAVKQFDAQLKELHAKQGYLHNVAGRVIIVPEGWEKDTLNRFIQSGAHDVLRLWVMEIEALRRERNLEMVPWILDIHDSTTWQVKKEEAHEAREIFEMALRRVNDRLGLCVSIRAETKFVDSLAGLKGD